MNCLIVEDEALIAMGYAQIVESAGHTVIGLCRSLPEAVDTTRVLRPDFALVDLRLGAGGCGATVDEYLHRTFGTVCVYITANADFAWRYRRTAIGYAEKPLAPDRMLALVRYLAARSHGRAVAPPHCLKLFAGHAEPADIRAPVAAEESSGAVWAPGTA